MDSILNMMKNPGGNLTGREKMAFDSVKQSVEKCTNDILNMPDWQETMVCCDLINNNAHLSQEFSDEVAALLNKKLNKGQTNIVWLSLNLLETIVKNCGHKMYRAVSSESFMKDLGKVAKKYCSKAEAGAENRRTADLALDIIQAWGEAFLPLRTEYPWISRVYQELKREGLPFRPEADLAHAPTIMAPPVRSSRPTPAPHSGDDDAALAAAIAASMKDVAPVRSAKPTGQAEQPFLSSTGPAETDDISALHQRRNSGRRGVDGYGESAPSAGSFVPSAATVNRSRGSSMADPSSSGGLSTLLTQTENCIELLVEVILASKDTLELRANEIGSELNTQLGGHQANLITAIETELQKGSDKLETIFQLNDKAGLVLSVYADYSKYQLKTHEAQEKLKSLIKPAGGSATVSGSGGDLLDLAFSSPTAGSITSAPQKSAGPTKPPPAATNADFDFFATPSGGAAVADPLFDVVARRPSTGSNGGGTKPPPAATKPPPAATNADFDCFAAPSGGAAAADPLFDVVARRPSTGSNGGGSELHSFFGGPSTAVDPAAGHDFFNPAPTPPAPSPQTQNTTQPFRMQTRAMPTNGLNNNNPEPIGMSTGVTQPFGQQQPPALQRAPVDPFPAGGATQTVPYRSTVPPPATPAAQPTKPPASANPFDIF